MGKVSTNSIRSICGRASHAQKLYLIHFFEKHPEVALNRFHSPDAAQEKEKIWTQLTIKLNSLEGVSKGRLKWQKFWSDYKKYTRKRFEKINEGDTNVLKSIKPLNDIEERVIRLLERQDKETQEKYIINSNDNNKIENEKSSSAINDETENSESTDIKPFMMVNTDELPLPITSTDIDVGIEPLQFSPQSLQLSPQSLQLSPQPEGSRKRILHNDDDQMDKVLVLKNEKIKLKKARLELENEKLKIKQEKLSIKRENLKLRKNMVILLHGIKNNLTALLQSKK